MADEIVKYSDKDNTVTGIKVGDIFTVTIIIQKNGENYTIESQTVEVVRRGSQNPILNIDLYPPPVTTTDNNVGITHEEVASNHLGGSSANVYSNEVYQLPKMKRKIKQVYNKTLSRKKHPSIVRG